jgi:prefoldin alpha subunit
MAEESENAPRVEDNIETLSYLSQLYQNQYAAITNEMNRNLEYIRELNEAQKSLENSNEISKKNALFHLGAGAYIDVKTDKVDRVLIGISGKYVIEKNIDDAKKYIAARIEKMNTIFNKLAKDRKELERALMEISYRAQMLTR